MRAPGAVRQSLAILLLPFNALVVVPGLLLWFGRDVDTRWGFDYALLALPRTAGLLLALAGLLLIVWTIGLFHDIGRGTLAPWDPTRRLVVDGPYRHVRNPMISGVAMVLLGDAVATGSVLVLGWATMFFFGNHLYFLASEEPALRRRFGNEYETYVQGVPRWLPRPTPWQRPDAPPPPPPDPRP